MGAGQLLGSLVCLLLTAAAIFLPIYYLSGEDSQNQFKNATGLDIPALPPSLADLPAELRDQLPEILSFQQEDPYHMLEPGEANKWATDGSGLDLELVNALDSQWYEYFDEAVTNWDNGSPDALTLTTSVASQPDSECKGIDGLQKVCNGDYGETDWKGINLVVFTNGIIMSSQAKMNDYFFQDGGDESKRLYTMCHEIGHGFGLPHTDESFWNRDLGNCLDYTNNYSGNSKPDQGNYEYLTELYGTVDGSIPAGSGIAGGDGSGSETGGDGSGSETGGDGSGSATGSSATSPERNIGNRERRSLFYAVENEARRRELESKWKQIDDIVNDTSGSRRLEELEGWRLLHRSEYGEAHEIDLGDNYRAQVHMLLA